MGSVLAGTPKASRQLWGAGGSLGGMGCPFLRAHFPTRMEVLLLAGRFTRSPVPSSLTASPRPPVRPHSVPLAVLFPRGQDSGFPVRLGSARLAISPWWFHTSRPGRLRWGLGERQRFWPGFLASWLGAEADAELQGSF